MGFKNGDSYRNRKNGFETMDGGQSGTPPKNFSIGRIIPLGIAAAVILILALNSTYEIKEQEQAVLITLGKAQAVTSPGLH